MRIDKFLADANFGSRKDVSLRIRKGAVTINGELVRKTDFQIDPDSDVVTFDGVAVAYEKYQYIMLNKPAGVLSAARDNTAKTVLDLIPATLYKKDLFPAGRLDKDTTGLLLITNDGVLAHRMLAPKSHVYKLYEARLDLPATKEDIAAFAAGITGGGDSFLPAELWCENKETPNRVKVRIREGKFHQIKRMFYCCGKEVVGLKRLQIGKLCLDENLPEGDCRKLTEDELQQIFS